MKSDWKALFLLIPSGISKSLWVVSYFKAIFFIGLWTFFILSVFGGCARHMEERSLNEWVAPSADHLWKPSQTEKPEKKIRAPEIDIPQNLLQPGAKWQLMDMIEVALRNNPQTRSAWYSARSAAADWLSQKGSYYPQIDIVANTYQTQNIAPDDVENRSIREFEPSVELSWLLFDFGGREASVEQKRQALLAADFTHNAVIQNSVLIVLQAYFRYMKAKSLVIASEASLHEASQNLDAAEQRHEKGLATIADVLQAKTARSQAQLNLDDARGQVQVIRGALATAMGIAANTPYDIEDLTWNPPIDKAMEEVEVYIQKAQDERPDLSAQKNRVKEATANIKSTRSALYPTLTLNNQFNGFIDNQQSQWANQNIAELAVNIPIFYGYSREYDLLKAEQDEKVQEETLNTIEQLVIYQVWSSYFNLKTSAQRVHTSRDLLESALQSYDVALGRYKEGVGGFLDLLAAQSTLENARAQRVEAMADWYISLANLAHDTGALWSQDQHQKGIMDMLPIPTVKENQP